MLGCATALAGCGLGVTQADLFSLTRAGPGRARTFLINDSGTIRCDGGPAKLLSGALLLRARALATALTTDAQTNLQLRPGTGSFFNYRIRMQQGTITFPDTAAAQHAELGPAEEFAQVIFRGPCP